MTCSMPTIREILEEVGVARPAATQTGFVLRRLYPERAVDLYVGKDLASGHPVLRLKVPSSDPVTPSESLSTSCVKVDRQQLLDDAPGVTSILVTLRDMRYLDQYCLVLEDFVHAARHVKDSTGACRLLVAKLRAWLRFFADDFMRMSEERQRGLIGELAVLEWAGQGLSWDTAIEGWTGPKAEDRDFRLPPWMMEVKTRLSGARDVVRVSNEFQLENEPNSNLYMCVATLGEDPEQGRSIVEWVHAVRAELQESAPGALVRFEELLQLAGYADVHFRGLSLRRYTNASYRLYSVRDGMPRLMARNLPPGVDHLTYHLNLADCAPFIVSEGALPPVRSLS